MKRTVLAACFAAFAAIGAPAAAQSVQDTLVAQLAEQGFTRIQIGRTFLGRTRIQATSPEYRREIIFNPRTGEILRDYWDELDGDDGGFRGRIAEPGQGASGGFGRDEDNDDRGSGSGSGSGRDDDDDRGSGSDDDRDDDDEDDDDDKPDRKRDRGEDDD